MLKPNPSIRAEASVADLSQLVRTVWRGKWMIAACLALTVPVGLAYAFWSSPYYTAQALLLIGPDRQVGGVAVVPDAGFGTSVEAINNELRVLQSRPVLDHVVDALDLMTSPVLNPALWQTPPATLVLPFIGAVRIPLLGGGATDKAPLDPDMQRRAVLDTLSSVVGVNQQGLSEVVAIYVTLGDRKLAAAIANGLAEAYITSKQAEKNDALRSTAGWLSQQLVELGTQSQRSADAVDKFRISQGLGDMNQVADLSTQLSRLRDNRASAGEIRRSLEARLGATGPDAVAPDRRAQLDADLRNAQSREAALMETAAGIEARLTALTQAGSKLAQLEQQAAADKFIYERFLEQSKQVYAVESLQQTGTRILERAEVPLIPAGPNKKVVMALAIFAGAALGGAIVFARELLRGTLRSREELEEVAGRPVIATLPFVPRSRDPAQFLRRLAANHHNRYGEHLRSLRNVIMAGPSTEGRVVAFTSTCPGEGKTVLCLALAMLAGRLGSCRAVVVDCDLRKSRLAKRLGLTGEANIANVLLGKTNPLDAIQVDGRFGIHVLPAITKQRSEPDLLHSPNFDKALAALRSKYDLVILDTPPVAPVMDVEVIAAHCDAVYFVTRWNWTGRALVSDTLNRLDRSGIDVAGVILNQVDLRREAAHRGVPYQSYREYWHA